MQTIAVFNSSEDTVDLLRVALEQAGFETVAAHVPDIQRGRTDVIDFIDRHRPAVVVYDVAPPYEQSWTFLKLLRSTSTFEHVGIVLTTTNKRVLEQLVGPTDAIEIIGKPYDVDQIVQTVRKTAADRD